MGNVLQPYQGVVVSSGNNLGKCAATLLGGGGK